jgi:hypothetical protein
MLHPTYLPTKSVIIVFSNGKHYISGADRKQTIGPIAGHRSRFHRTVQDSFSFLANVKKRLVR